MDLLGKVDPIEIILESLFGFLCEFGPRPFSVGIVENRVSQTGIASTKGLVSA